MVGLGQFLQDVQPHAAKESGTSICRGTRMALLWHDSTARFEFQCVAGHQTATRKGLAYWPFKIRAAQWHSKRAISTAAASDTFNATAIYADSSAAALKKVSATGKTIITPEETPGVIYYRTTRGNWKGILDSGFIPGGGDRVSSGRAHSYLSEARVEEGNYVSGLRADCPVEIRVAMQEAVRDGVVFIDRKESGQLTLCRHSLWYLSMTLKRR